MSNYRENYQTWLDSGVLTDAEKAELESLDEKEIRERFSSYLSFGTAGLRGTMRAGINGMNVRTVALATQGIADWINSRGEADRGVAIACDSRNNSRLFSETAASILAANKIKVFIFDSIRPTPELSFALRTLSCAAGINITASHNPKEYNGYKAYGADGAQLDKETADEISAFIAKLDIFKDIKTVDFDKAVKDGEITVIGEEMDKKYLDAVFAESVNPDTVKKAAGDLRIVYSPLHGTGYRLVPAILRRLGLTQLYMVEEQSTPNGDFPTVIHPNPEYLEAFELGIKLADKVGSDLIIATDPDTDRVGVFARDSDGKFCGITGNQMGAMLIDYILTAYENTGKMPPEPYVVKSIVTTELATKVCRSHGVEICNVLTGFKFIGEVIKKHEAAGHGSFILGFEESYGYLKGTYARDKDAVVAAMLICEMAAYYRLRGMTLIDARRELWDRLGYSYEVNTEIYCKGLDGAARITGIMKELRDNPPANIGGNGIAVVGDYQKGTITDKKSGKVTPTGLPASNVMSFTLDNGDVVVARPSGTEPKIKFYYLISSAADEAAAKALCESYKATIDNYN